MEIKHYEKIQNTIAVPVILRAAAELAEVGLCERLIIPLNWDDQAIVATRDGVSIGVISFTVAEWLRVATIKFGWVEFESRSEGVYRAMWQYLIDLVAKDGKIDWIDGTTSVNNTVMRKVAASLGRVEQSINLKYRIVRSVGD